MSRERTVTPATASSRTGEFNVLLVTQPTRDIQEFIEEPRDEGVRLFAQYNRQA